MNLIQQYQNLENKKLWRIFKVLYFLLAIAWVSVGVFLFFDEASNPYTNDATGYIVGTIIVAIGAFILYWIIKRTIAYIVYGKAERVI